MNRLNSFLNSRPAGITLSVGLLIINGLWRIFEAIYSGSMLANFYYKDSSILTSPSIFLPLVQKAIGGIIICLVAIQLWKSKSWAYWAVIAFSSLQLIVVTIGFTNGSHSRFQLINQWVLLGPVVVLLLLNVKRVRKTR